MLMEIAQKLLVLMINIGMDQNVKIVMPLVLPVALEQPQIV